MRDLAVPFLHLLARVARLVGPGARAVVAESVFVKHQLLILNPFVERLIGTIRRECLDRTLCWTAADLEAEAP